MSGYPRPRTALMALLATVFLLSSATAALGGDPENIGTAPSAKYGNGPQVAYAFNKDYTVYGVGRSATSQAAEQLAQRNCTGPDCAGGELRGVQARVPGHHEDRQGDLPGFLGRHDIQRGPGPEKMPKNHRLSLRAGGVHLLQPSRVAEEKA
jgi:hypothetical protein